MPSKGALRQVDSDQQLNRDVIPGGSQTLSKARGRFPSAYPSSLVSGAGSHVRSQDGRDYIDWICSLGAVSLGYGVVDEAVTAQVRRGPIFSISSLGLERSVAERLIDMIPCAESVRYLKSGSESVEAAIRVARAATGRDIILTCGYHGWHSWYAATREDAPGVPFAMTRLAHG